ncbi:response regulator [Sorangium atrum]|uniref:Response regulator n=1 Tax=Sorangium atrum TaxID=2995308 RepID=A0ABT5BTG6_9BACT|nr:response regulator [Sorangium aterium]MDC0677454.1 response regulator [Sorangium aterium]
MSGDGRILIVDDDPAFLETYEEILAAEGYAVETATTHAEALRRLDEPGWTVVLVDQKLQGPGGPDSGLGLIDETRRRAPGAKVLLVTAYASREAVERAFREGAYDYLEKTAVFEALLRVKVRNAMEAVRERWLATLDMDETERAIRATWAAVQAERDRNRRGTLLERLMALLLKTLPGFERLDTRLRNEVEEIDIIVQNRSTDPFWQKESPYLLVECKNWSKHVGSKELRDLWAKMEGRFDRCRLALLVAPGGIADTVRQLQLRKAEKGLLVVLIGPGDLDELVQRRDRSDALQEMHRRAVMGAAERERDELP